jgi:hypothetical protein
MGSMLTFDDGYVTIQLSLFQCATLAKACYFASEGSCEAEIELWRTLAALFHACCVAGYAQWHLSSPDLEVLLEQLAMLNLRKGGNDDDKSRLNGHGH